MKQFYLIVLMLLLCAATAFSQQNPWQRISGVSSKSPVLKNKLTLLKPTLFELNISSLKSSLTGAPKRNGRISSGRVVSFPDKAGKLENFSVVESSNMDPVLAAKYPDIKSYVGKGVDNPAQTIYFSVSPQGIQSMLIRPDQPTIFLEPYTEDKQTYVVYQSSDNAKPLTPFECRVMETGKKNLRIGDAATVANRPNADDGLLRTYRLALSCTGEYAQYFGGTVPLALAAMNASMTRVNGIFETDFGVHMNMIANNDRLVYLNPTTDPYTSDARLALSDHRWITELNNTLTQIIGSTAYDIGHVLVGVGGGGAAGIRTVCPGSPTDPYFGTGGGFTSGEDPEGHEFDVRLVAHEMGHQFGADHVFSFMIEGTGVQVEPAHGSSIMSYNYGVPQLEGQPSYGTYFNAVSIRQVTDFIKSATCAVNIPTGNAIPTANAGPDYTIPKSTAFVLKGTATDANGDALTYNWEQQDAATQPTLSLSSTATSGPAFASLYPSTVPYRSFPTLSTVLSGSVASMWEVVPSVARSMNFRFTVRDNRQGGPANNSDDMVVNVSAASGPFVVTAPNTVATWMMGSTQTITWNVAGTTTAPVSCANVKISLSTDGGLTFPTVLLASTPNDGSQSITVPNLPSAACRIKLEAIGNIFYDISNVNFYISNTGVHNITSSAWPFGFGTISPDGVTPVVGGSNKTYTMTPCADCSLNDVVVDGVSKGPITTYTFTNVTAPHSISATFRNLGCDGAPGPAITGQTSNLCNGKTVTYRAALVDGTDTYNWTVPAGFTVISGQGTNKITLKTPWTFSTAVLKVSFVHACGTSAPTSLTLNGAPGDLSAEMTGPSQVTIGSVNVYSLPLIPGVIYVSWMADGGSFVGGWGTNNASIRAGTMNGYVKATVKNSCGTGPVAKKFFTVQPGGGCVAPNLSAAITNVTCVGTNTGAINLTAASGSNPYTYRWTGPNGFMSTAEDISAVAAGIYTVTVTATGGCTKAATYVINPGVGAPLVPTITGQASNLCGAKLVAFTASEVPSVSSYTWTIPSGFTLINGQGSPSIVIRSPYTFSTAELKVVANSACGSSAPASLTLTAAPGDMSADITGPSQVVTGSVNVYSLPLIPGLIYVSWMADGGSFVGGWGTNNASIRAGTMNGYVKATVKNACGTGPIAKKYFTVQPSSSQSLLSNSEIDGPEVAFRAYPNPVQDVATVVFNAKEKDTRYELRVVDIYGRVLMAKKGLTNAGVNTLQINLGKHTNGIYMVTLLTDNKIRSQKLFKNN